MPWPTQNDLESLGRPSRKELLWTFAGFPILLVALPIWVRRVWRSFQGHPLETLLAKADINGPFWAFAGVVAIYLIAILLAVGGLWGCYLEVRRWLYWRRRVDGAED